MPDSQQTEKSIEITVKLFGTLARGFKNYDRQKGMAVLLAPDAEVADLLRRLNLSGKNIVVVKDGRVVNDSEPLTHGCLISLMQPAHGG
ncbi:MAG: MoaD/ThiS family protein [Desulfobacterales bacterium]